MVLGDWGLTNLEKGHWLLHTFHVYFKSGMN